jgi:hypothetical protein
MGEIMPRWDAIATTLGEGEDFDRVVDGKKLQSRFNLLVEKHRKANKESMALSGVDEDESETTKLLDEMVELIDDKKATQAEKKDKKKVEEAKAEAAAETIRTAAMQTCKKRKADDKNNETSRSGPNAMIDLMKAELEVDKTVRLQELAFKRAKAEKEAEERDMDRKLMLARLEQDERARLKELELREKELEDRKTERAHLLRMAEFEERKLRFMMQNKE